jgi:peptidoglycan-associated lipoprotein
MFRSIFVLFALLFTVGCSRSNETWEDMKTAGRYMQRGVDSILGKEYESRMLASGEDFYGPYDDDFIPLKDADLRQQMADGALPQPKGAMPNLHLFHGAPEGLRSLFSSVHFDTDDHAIRNKAEIDMLVKLAAYLKKNPEVYLMVEGHTDERASASYNQALGMRRANAVRSFLVKHGADLNRIYTASRGKEQPVCLGHGQEDWRQNRRSEFKIYQR